MIKKESNKNPFRRLDIIIKKVNLLSILIRLVNSNTLVLTLL